MKRKLREWRTQKCNPCFREKAHLAFVPGQQTTRFHAAPYGTVSANLRRSGIPFAEVPFCTNPIYIWGSYGNGEPKNAILVLVQKAHLAVRASKLPGFMQRRMGPSVQICGKSGLPFAEVPCLHQSNLHMKRKLREWRTQKCNPCFGAESPPRSTRLQTTRFYAAPYGTVSANLRTVFAPIQCKFAESRGFLSPSRGFLSPRYGTVSANLQKVGTFFRRGTVFAPIQSTYEKEAKGMKNPKMQSLFWCRKPTS